MFTVSRTLKVNDTPGAPTLKRGDVWRGLMMKAENPVPFVAPMERCTVVERGDNWLLRDIHLRGEDMQERVTFEPERRVTFERTKSSAMGSILNEIVEGEESEDGGLGLKFTFSLEMEGIAPGSDAERDIADRMADSYLDAVNTTLAEIRRLVESGEMA